MLLPIPDDILRAQARERLHDMLLGGLGLMAAAAAASFAGYMVLSRPADRATPAGPVVARGLPFARPAAGGAGAPSDDLSALADEPVDFTPTGTIPDRAGRPDLPAGTRPVLPDFAVRDVFDDTALVEVHGTLQMVRPRSVLAGAGEVLSITRKGGGWVVSTAAGDIAQRR